MLTFESKIYSARIDLFLWRASFDSSLDRYDHSQRESYSWNIIFLVNNDPPFHLFRFLLTNSLARDIRFSRITTFHDVSISGAGGGGGGDGGGCSSTAESAVVESPLCYREIPRKIDVKIYPRKTYPSFRFQRTFNLTFMLNFQ